MEKRIKRQACNRSLTDKDDEFFKELPNEKHKNYVDYLLEKYGRRN